MAYLYQKIWIPRSKRELVEILGRKWPKDKPKFQKMKKERLMAIYLNMRKAAQIDTSGF